MKTIVYIARSVYEEVLGLYRIGQNARHAGAIHRYLARKWRLMQEIEENATLEGKLYVEESTPGSLSAPYTVWIHAIHADIREYYELRANINDLTRTPFRLRIVTASEAKDIERYTRAVLGDLEWAKEFSYRKMTDLEFC